GQTPQVSTLPPADPEPSPPLIIDPLPTPAPDNRNSLPTTLPPPSIGSSPQIILDDPNAQSVEKSPDGKAEILPDGQKSEGKPDGERPSEKAKNPLAGWDNGFYLRSEDKRFQLKFTGQMQTDYRQFIDQPDFTDINTFLIRRARLGIEANVF